MSDQYGYKEPARNLVPLPPEGSFSDFLSSTAHHDDQGTTRVRFELSTTTRGWDYSGTVEITSPNANLTEQEAVELVERAAHLQEQLRISGTAERNARNQADKLGPWAPVKTK